MDKFNTPPPPLRPGRRAKLFQRLPHGNEAYLTQGFRLPRYALQGIVDITAAWKVLGEDDVPARFYRRNVFFLNPNGQCTGPHLVGLVGFHIHRVVPFGTNEMGQVGATFEQIDSVGLNDPDEGPWKRPPHPSFNPESPDGSPPVYDTGL